MDCKKCGKPVSPQITPDTNVIMYDCEHCQWVGYATRRKEEAEPPPSMVFDEHDDLPEPEPEPAFRDG